MRAKRAFICEICGICERSFWNFMALLGICKSFTTEVTKEYTKFAKLYCEALCFNEVAEFNDPVFAPLLQSFKK